MDVRLRFIGWPTASATRLACQRSQNSRHPARPKCDQARLLRCHGVFLLVGCLPAVASCCAHLPVLVVGFLLAVGCLADSLPVGCLLAAVAPCAHPLSIQRSASVAGTSTTVSPGPYTAPSWTTW